MSDFLDLSNINIVTNSLLSEEEFPILKGLSPLNIRILNGSSRLVTIDQGVETLHEGDNPRDLYFIRTGCVSIAKEGGQQRKVLASLKSGDIFGEFAILRNKPRYASVYTAKACEIIRVNGSAVHQVLEADYSFKERLQSILSQRMLNSFLFSHPIFQTLPENLRLTFSKDLQTKFTACDTQLLTQGEETQTITLILSGNVEVYHTDALGKECLLEIRRNHDVLGELASNQGKTSAYSAIAASDLDILPLNQNAMQYIKKHHSETFKRLELYIHKRAQHTAKRLTEKTSV
ncbi:MAG: cyclic nucleotide-binding domain-containing protein [Zetaproteobacteria bacterium]|nr:cyclic nucleotide-binding domain-containing protein [Zetaproteobacteria bacterium]